MRIILCVTNDIVTDQRVSRIALSLKKLPSEVIIIGIKRSRSLPVISTSHEIKRFGMIFLKGPLFYVEYNMRLFFYLLFARPGIVVSNDLDTLPAAYMACSILNRPVVYDSHEYFTGLPELVDRPFIHGVWHKIESRILPRIKYAYTVNESIASEYQNKYGIKFRVFRNLPARIISLQSTYPKKPGEKLIIYQGALNMGRGIESAIKAMKYLDSCRLLIAGSGYLEQELKNLTRSSGLDGKVQFLGLLRPEDLLKITASADLGISLEESKGMNYYYALPNKLFDYIQARLPVLVSDLPEMASLVLKYDVGMVTRTNDPLELSKAFYALLYDDELKKRLSVKLEEAAAELCWENEEPGLISLYRQIIGDHAFLTSDKSSR